MSDCPHIPADLDPVTIETCAKVAEYVLEADGPAAKAAASAIRSLMIVVARAKPEKAA